jgi:Cu(I)-responsive transcriptional regulator
MNQENVLIGVAAKLAGVSIKMARHYEAIGLLSAALRSRNGSRMFSQADVHTLRFIARARELGFPLRTVRRLLSLWQQPDRSNAETRQLAEQHLRELQAKRAALDAVLATLQQLIDACAGDGRPDCPILDDLAEPASPVGPRTGRRPSYRVPG